MRLLIEHSTGIYSGAMETNATLTDMLHGEGFCGQRLSAVQVEKLPMMLSFSILITVYFTSFDASAFELSIAGESP